MVAEKLLRDTHRAEAERVATSLERLPGQTRVEVELDADVGSGSKVLSVMAKELGYRLAYGWRHAPCASGKRYRRVRIYTLLSRPDAEPDLFQSQ